MRMVVLTVGEADRQLEPLLRCNSSLSILHAQAPWVSLHGGGPDLVILPQPQRLSCPRAILLLRRGGQLPQTVHCGQLVAVADSSDTRSLQQLAKRQLPAVTCGFSHQDTFTLSSLTSDSAVISLQRSLRAFDGSTSEPFELPVSLPHPMDPFTLLSCAAVFCLLGQKNPLIGLPLWAVHLPTQKQWGPSSFSQGISPSLHKNFQS